MQFFHSHPRWDDWHVSNDLMSERWRHSGQWFNTVWCSAGLIYINIWYNPNLYCAIRLNTPPSLRETKRPRLHLLDWQIQRPHRLHGDRHIQRPHLLHWILMLYFRSHDVAPRYCPTKTTILTMQTKRPCMSAWRELEWWKRRFYLFIYNYS